MDNLFYSREEEDEDVENVRKINLDELYDTKKEKDLQKLQVFNRILNRIHTKIKMTSRQKINSNFCWYVIPEVMLGIVNYDRVMCISYIIAKLEENDFQIRYTHPNLVFISWGHYIPTYVRTEFKKKTGISIDEHGNKKEDGGNDNSEDGGSGGGGGIRLITNSNSGGGDNANIDHTLLNRNKTSSSSNANPNLVKKEYKPINSYKPTGNLVYSKDFLTKIDERMNN
uniref:Uncharacterized protein n=1 Tax=viral metagenome TaxID=1070528 RepID=A0A6C0I3D4_9ZZZZ